MVRRCSQSPPTPNKPRELDTEYVMQTSRECRSARTCAFRRVMVLCSVGFWLLASCRQNQTFYRIGSPDGSCFLTAEIAKYGYLGSRVRFECAGHQPVVRHLYKDFEPGAALVIWHTRGKGSALLCNRMSRSILALSLTAGAGTIETLDRDRREFIELAAQATLKYPVLSGGTSFDTLTRFCESDQVLADFKKAHPTLR